MKVSFFSNFLNHHQLPFCKAMNCILGNNFKFIATECVHKERLDMGYYDMSKDYSFSINSYESNEDYVNALKLGDESDVVIIGSAPRVFVENRIKKNMLTFYYTERIFRKERWRIFNLRCLLSLFKNHTLNKFKKIYLLCASAFTAADFNMAGAYKNKAYKWGYFPNVKKHNVQELLKKKENIIPEILWVGRLLELKHPDHVVKVADMLKKSGYKFNLRIIGTGEMEVKVKKLIKDLNLFDRVNILGSMSPEDVRFYMENANIYLFTSDFQEGWGAVLNEAMNSGCAVIASHAIGSVPFLLKNNENGLIYENGDLNHLFECVKKLLEDKHLRDKLGKNAYETMEKNWNADVAAERFINLSESLLKGEQFYFEDGPCSKAEAITNDWFVIKSI